VDRIAGIVRSLYELHQVTPPHAHDVVVSAGAGLGAVSTATNYSGTQSGVNVLAGSTRGLWFNLDMPTSSSVSTQRSFTVELEAQ
jgi:hypothetical protein